MKKSFKEQFLILWKKYFGDSELPITFYYSEGEGGAEKFRTNKQWNCIICELGRIRKGESLYFNGVSLKCGGSKRYLGYADKMRPDFEYFLSCGIPGKMEGERYIRTPEMVREIMKNQRSIPAEEKNIIFKRWDKLEETDEPEVVIFFASPDVLSGLFTLANFDQVEPNSTFTPFGAGCSSIVHYPFFEKDAERPRAVIGLFDPSARPCVPSGVLTFAVPFSKFVNMVSYMEESFLVTDTWEVVKERIATDHKGN